MLRDENRLVPVKQAEGEVAAFLQIGEAPSNAYYETIKQHIRVEALFLPLDYTESSEQQALLKRLEKYPLVILAIFPADPRRIAQIRLLNAQKQIEELSNFRAHGMPGEIVKLVNALESNHKKTIVSFFGNPFGLHFFNGFSTVIMGYEDDPDAQQSAAKILNDTVY